MRAVTPIAVGPGLVVAADGPEVLAWATGDSQPRWQVQGDARYAAVALDGDAVWLVDERGALERRSAHDGSLVQRLPGVASGGLLAAREGVVVHGTAGGLGWRVDGVEDGELDVVGALALALDGHGHLAVVDAEGGLAVIALTDGVGLGRVALGGRGAGVVALPDGAWLAVAGGRLVRASADAREAHALVDVAEAGPVGVSGGVALVAGERRVEVVDLVDRRSLGHVALGRTVAGLAVDAAGRAWLAMDHGDVARLDLAAGAVDALPPPRGRARASWAVELRVDPAEVRRAAVRRVIGDGPVAVRRRAPGRGARRWVRWVALGAAAVGLLALVAWWTLG